MDNTCYIFIELWGMRFGEPGRDFLYGGNPILFIDNLTEHQAYAAGEAVNAARKYAMSVYAHARYPQYDEIDVSYYIHDNDEDTDHIDDEQWCEVLYLKED